MAVVSVSAANFRLMTDNVSRTEAKIVSEGYPVRAPNEAGAASV